MKEKETNPRLAEAIRQNKPPMLRCWVNEHSRAALFSNEAHVIVERIDGRPDWDIMPEEEIIYLGVSQKGDALGPFRDAYVHVAVFPQLSDEEGFVVGLFRGCEEIRTKVAKESIVFADSKDPIWDEIGKKLEEEAEGKIPEFKPLKPNQFAIDLATGTAVLREEK